MLVNSNLIELKINGNNKETAIRELAKLIDNENRLNDYDDYIEEVLRRESLISTGIGYGIAIPHGKCKAVKVPTVAFGRLCSEIEWESLDDKPIKIIFLLAVPESCASNDHLKILAALSRKLMYEDFRNQLLEIDDKDKLLQLLSETLKDVLN